MSVTTLTERELITKLGQSIDLLLAWLEYDSYDANCKRLVRNPFCSEDIRRAKAARILAREWLDANRA